MRICALRERAEQSETSHAAFVILSSHFSVWDGAELKRMEEKERWCDSKIQNEHPSSAKCKYKLVLASEIELLASCPITNLEL